MENPTHLVDLEILGMIFAEDSLILLCAKQVGFANCRCGCESNLLKIHDHIDFELGEPEDPLYEELSKEEIQQIVRAMHYERKMKKIRERRKRRNKKRRLD